MAFVHPVEKYEPWPGTPSFHCREFLAKNEVFEKHPATTVEESEDHTCQEYKRVYHVRVVSGFACEWQCRILLKSQTDTILARDRTEFWRATVILSHQGTGQSPQGSDPHRGGT
jgi:hypothetical protein